MGPGIEYEEAMRLYRKKLTEGAGLFRPAAPTPSAALSHRQAETWFLLDQEGRLLARVGPGGVRLAL